MPQYILKISTLTCKFIFLRRTWAPIMYSYHWFFLWAQGCFLFVQKSIPSLGEFAEEWKSSNVLAAFKLITVTGMPCDLRILYFFMEGKPWINCTDLPFPFGICLIDAYCLVLPTAKVVQKLVSWPYDWKPSIRVCPNLWKF